MVRLSFIFSVAVSLSLAAQPMRVNTPQPISVIRNGVVAARSIEPLVASNGSSFLMAWADDRFVTQSTGGQYYAAHLLTRVDADGTLLDESPIAIPFGPVGIVWSGSEWIVAGYVTLARISAEGTILEMRPIGEANFTAIGAAWAGNGLVVAGLVTEGPAGFATGGVRTLTFDAQLHRVASTQLTDTSSKIVAIAGDGQSAILLWCNPDESQGKSLHAASFGPDGLFQRVSFNLVHGDVQPYPYAYTSPIGANGNGYVFLYPGSSIRYKAVLIERDLETRAIPLNDALYFGAPALAWDGTSLTLYSTYHDQRLLATRFSADGSIVSPARQVGVVGSTFLPEVAAAGIEGKTVVAYGSWDASLKFRVIATPSFADSPERQPSGAGPLPQDVPVTVSTPSQSLVAWRERTSPAEWAVYATRLDGNATVLDPESLLLATSSCDGLQPAVATDGENYLAAWHDKDGIGTASIRADGTVTKRPVIPARYGVTCTGAALKLVSNGTDYLLLWAERPPRATDLWDVFGLRLRPDGSIIGLISLGQMKSGDSDGLKFLGASNGQDYLVAWDGAAVRVSSEGAVLDASQKILLGTGLLINLWWNEKTYVAQTTSNSGYRFLRIGSDGSGGRPPAGPQADPVPFPTGPGRTYAGSSACNAAGCWDGPSACDAAGCWVGATTRHADGHDTLTAIRYDDDGTQISIRRQDVENVSYTSINDDAPIAAVIVNAGRPAFLFLPQRMEQPFSSVHRLMIAPFAVPRGRAARHP